MKLKKKKYTNIQIMKVKWNKKKNGKNKLK